MEGAVRRHKPDATFPTPDLAPGAGSMVAAVAPPRIGSRW